MRFVVVFVPNGFNILFEKKGMNRMDHCKQIENAFINVYSP